MQTADLGADEDPELDERPELSPRAARRLHPPPIFQQL